MVKTGFVDFRQFVFCKSSLDVIDKDIDAIDEKFNPRVTDEPFAD